MQYPKTEADWLAMRHLVVSSTESAALFGLSPYLTAFELAIGKKEALPTLFEQTERMVWGLRLQEAVAKGISEDYGVKVRRVTGFAVHPDISLGASFDYEIVGIRTNADGSAVEVKDMMLQQMYRDLGPGVLEVKNVDNYIFRQEWKPDEESGEVEAPAHIEIQVQHQLAAIQTRKWSAVAVLIGGNKAFILLREIDPDFVTQLENKVDGFWTDLGKGVMPPPVLPADVEIIRRIYLGSKPGKVYNGQDDTELLQLCQEYETAKDLAKVNEEARKSAGAKILMKIGDAEIALAKGFKISATTVGEALIESYTRKPYRMCKITALKERK
jgi:predicted phage-related endonuclease